MTARPEILAPAGGPAALEAAIACGADAVYLGAGAFNARRGAENFTLDGLADVVRHCHIRGTSVHLALNILMLEQERDALLQSAQAACAAGVDAVIVQDLGVAALLRECAPGLCLHASTQMAVHNVSGARQLEQLGFSRVVLARECTREEIARIAASTSLEVEVFVHGAQCMSVSGQCYMSSVLGQRSGNRGLCAQPCRLAFQCGGTDHALSLKDMCLVPHLRDLAGLGVASFKIEGRMKRPEYVAAAVTACRDALEGRTPDLESLRAVFSRSGFTDGYYRGLRDADLFGIRGKEDVTAASGVLGKLSQLYTDPKRHVQKGSVTFDFVMDEGKPALLEADDGEGHHACVEGPVPEIALQKPATPERVQASLEKTGGTPYRPGGTRCRIGEGLMLPASAVNAMRRQALESLDGQRGANRPIPFDASNVHTPAGARHADSPELRVWAAHPEQVSPGMLEEADLISLPLPALARVVRGGVSPLLRYREKLCAEIPRICYEAEEEAGAQLAYLAGHGIAHAQAGNLGGAWLARKTGMEWHASSFFNVVNSHAAKALLDLGASDICLSQELSLAGAAGLSVAAPVGVVVYGHLPLMTVRACPVKAFAGCEQCRYGEAVLADRKGNRLRTDCARGCSEVLNPVPLYMADRLAELRGLDFAALRFTTESPVSCDERFREYMDGAKPGFPFTRGLLYKKIQ